MARDPVEVRLLEPGEEEVLDDVLPDVSDHPVIPRLVREFLADGRHHLAVAVDRGRVVGMASAVHYAWAASVDTASGSSRITAGILQSRERRSRRSSTAKLRFAPSHPRTEDAPWNG